MTQSIAQAILWCGESLARYGEPIANLSAVCAVRRLASPPLASASSRGFSLVEVLVAVIVLAVGLLGMASLQMSVLKANDSAKLRTLATQASADLADRIRADPGASLPNVSSSTDCPSTTCTNAASCLKRDFCALGLPNSSLVVDCDAGTANCGAGNCSIIVSWDDKRGDVKRTTAHQAVFSTCVRLPGR